MKISFTKTLLVSLCLSILMACDKTEETPVFELNSFQNQAMNYFGEVALGFEAGGSSEITRRWQSPVRIFVGGEYDQRQFQELESVIVELNELIDPTSSIEIVTDTLLSNSYFHFGSAASYIEIFPDMQGLLTGNVGYFNVWWNQDIINRSRVFVDTQRLSFNQQKSLIREELVQSMGLGKDSPLYPNSIFYETATDGGFAESLSNLDREVIRLLYHPMMRTRLNRSQAESVIRNIYESEAPN